MLKKETMAMLATVQNKTQKVCRLDLAVNGAAKAFLPSIRGSLSQSRMWARGATQSAS
jgi:hypothetical protein